MGCCSAGFAKHAPRIASEQQLHDVYQSLDTGDLLLFNSGGATGCCTRCFTGAQWDHVGVIIKRRVSDGPREPPITQQASPADHQCAQDYCTCVAEPESVLEILESTGAGVHVYAMDDRLARLANHHHYIGVVKRKQPPTDAQKLNLEEFVQKVRGRAYEALTSGDMCHAWFMSCCCCWSDKQKMSRKERKEWLEKQEERFFCSELAACALGSLGTLDIKGNHQFDFSGNKHEARSFLPNDFCDYMRQHDGRSLWNESTKVPELYESTQLLQYPGSVYDTFLKKLKKQLWEERGDKSVVHRSYNDACTICHADGHETCNCGDDLTVNPAAGVEPSGLKEHPKLAPCG